MTTQELNNKYGLSTVQFVDGPGGLVFAEIDNAGGAARICLQGAHVVTWKPKAQAEPVIWVSDMATFAPGKSIRGGVPICWPWFGPHATESGFPGHGFARTVLWEVTAATEHGATTELTLTLVDTEQTRAQWPHATRAELKVSVGERLGVSLATQNLGTEPILLGEALHTYLRIGDIGRIAVSGLEDTEYVDKVDGGARKRQAGAVEFSGEVDRVYLNTGGECVIRDPDLGRGIRIAKTGSQSTVVWTPWQDKALKMGDFGPGRSGQGGWREMVCVESGNALDNVITLAPGARHALDVIYDVVPLA